MLFFRNNVTEFDKTTHLHAFPEGRSIFLFSLDYAVHCGVVTTTQLHADAFLRMYVHHL